MALQRIFLSRDMEHVKYLKSCLTPEMDLQVLYASDEIFNHFKGWLLKQSEVALDIESTHFDPYCGRILLTSFYANDKIVTFDNDTIPIEMMITSEELKDITVVAHNLKFETLWFLKHNIHFRKTFCTMLSEQKLLQGGDVYHNIIDVLKRRGIIIPEEMDKSIREEFSNGVYQKPEIKHILYNQGDVLELLQLKKQQEVLMERFNLTFFLNQIHFPLIRTLAMAEMEGLVINEPKFIALAEEAEKKMLKIAGEMSQCMARVYPAVDMVEYNKPIKEKITQLENQRIRLQERRIKSQSLRLNLEITGKTHLKSYRVIGETMSKIDGQDAEILVKLQELDTIKTISWTASQQMLKLLNSVGCYPIAKDKKTGVFKPSLAKAARERWLLQNLHHAAHPLMKLYDDYMKQTKHVNSFGKSFLVKYKHPVTGKYHTSYKQGTVETGRLASGNSDQKPARFNSQQLPPVIRDCFGTDPGYKVGTCDLTGAELITMCSIAQDHRLLELSKTQDLHSYFANLGWSAIYKYRDVNWTEADVISKDQNPKKRRAYKPMLFGAVYGLRPPKAAETLNVSESEGAIALGTITREIPATMKMVKDSVAFAFKHGYIIHNTRTNSRRWFPEVLRENEGRGRMTFMERSAVDGAARNTRIQGTQADMLCEAMVLLQRFIDRYKLDAKILMQVHDELVVKFKSEYEPWFPGRLKDIMTRTADKYLTGGVVMDGEVLCGDSWLKEDPNKKEKK